jgi:flagellar biosynthesis protein FliR
LLSSLVIYAYQMMGDLIDYFRAANMSRLLVPETKCHTSPLGVFMSQMALVIFLSLGLHREVIKSALTSFHWFPVFSNDAKLGDNLLKISLDLGGKLLYTSLRLSLPMLAITLLIDLGFGLLNRIAPQINVYFLSLPAKMIGVLIMLLIAFPLIVSEFLTYHHEFFSWWERILPV